MPWAEQTVSTVPGRLGVGLQRSDESVLDSGAKRMSAPREVVGSSLRGIEVAALPFRSASALDGLEAPRRRP